MTIAQYNKATPLIEELEPLEKMLDDCKKSSPTITVNGTKLNNFSSPTGNKILNEAVIAELTSRIDHIKNQIAAI